jgi:tRNA(fMet)-specific endonuclease VapC
VSRTHLLDTDVVVDVLRRRSPDARARLESFGEGVSVSSISEMELRYGAARSARPADNARAVEEFLSFVSIEPFDRGAAVHSGEIRADLARAGRPIAAYDVLLAGHARALSVVLVTGNAQEFSRVDGLRVLDWPRA